MRAMSFILVFLFWASLISSIPGRAKLVFWVFFLVCILVPYCLPLLAKNKKYLTLLISFCVPVLGILIWREQEYASAMYYRDYSDFSLGLLTLVALFFGLGVVVRFISFSMLDRKWSIVWTESLVGLVFIAPFAFVAVTYVSNQLIRSVPVY